MVPMGPSTMIDQIGLIMVKKHGNLPARTHTNAYTVKIMQESYCQNLQGWFKNSCSIIQIMVIHWKTWRPGVDQFSYTFKAYKIVL